MRISDWSSDVCSSDLLGLITRVVDDEALAEEADKVVAQLSASATRAMGRTRNLLLSSFTNSLEEQMELEARAISLSSRDEGREGVAAFLEKRKPDRSEEHTSELQSLMRNTYAVLCLKK